MESYRYHIITASGKEKRGTITANDRRHAMMILKADGSTVINLDYPGLFDRELEIPFFHTNVKSRDMSVFCRQFITLIEAGISIVRALDMLEKQTVNRLLKKSIREIKESVEKGENLAESMKHHREVFPSMFVNMVRSGEEAGKLKLSFERMALYYEKTAKLKNIVKRAMIYPVILSVVAILVILVMLIYIVPMYTQMFEQMGAELPVFTRMVVAVSDFLIRYWYWVGLFSFLLYIGLKGYASTDSGDYMISNLALNLPLVGKLKQKNACARFSRNLSTLFGAGVSIIDALEISANTMDNIIYRLAIQNAKEQISRGIPLSVPLCESGIFPPLVYHMVGIGEETGRLDTMLDKAAEYYEEEVMAATEQAAAALEPLIIVGMAFIVIAIIAAIFTPMIAMYSNIEYL